MDQLNDNQQAVLDLLANVLFQANRPIDLNLDWEGIYRESSQQTVSILTYYGLPNEILGRDSISEWKEHVIRMTSKGVCNNYDHYELHELLTNADIPYVILKGNVSASYYPDPFMRITGDVDFLIDKKDIKKADQILKENGFYSVKSNHQLEIAYHKDNSIWELHWDINGIPDGEIGDLIHGFFDTIIQDSTEVSTSDGCYQRPTDFHHGMVMILHIARHMITGGIGLRHLCDWAVFVQSLGNRFSELFEIPLKKIGMWKFAQVLSQLSVVYLGCDDQDWMGEIDSDLLLELIIDVFNGGNFGKKDTQRSDEAKFITSRKKGKVNDDSVLKQSILSLNEIVIKHWPIADKLPFLLPLGWIFFGGRYVFRMVIGKRPQIPVNDLVNGAQKRKIIYKQLNLFEV